MDKPLQLKQKQEQRQPPNGWRGNKRDEQQATTSYGATTNKARRS